jgi:1-pyrroline-5-carboxylate dehydrogenase
MSAAFVVPEPRNEPVLSFAPHTAERKALKAELERAAAQIASLPLVIGGEHVETGKTTDVVMPHDRHRNIGRWHNATTAHVEKAIAAAEAARPLWAALPFEARASILLKAADLLTGPWRWRMLAATMLGQSKTAHQAEIDCVCELADFWRFNVAFADRILREQPLSSLGMWNRLEYRPLDGFVFAVTPFNFTAIGGNLPTAPALMGNTVVWKPASTAMLSASVVMRILEEAGLPPGVINLVGGNAAQISDTVLASPHLGGIHFTGSTSTFQHLWSTVGKNIGKYRQYPRLVGETGGKDFIFAHASADEDALITAIVRGGFEYQGQKCSAASRVYVPRSMWKRIQPRLVETIESIEVGDVSDFSNFMGAVIDAKSFAKIKSYVDLAKNDSACTVLAGGSCDDSRGWFIRPTLIESADPKHHLMREEIFGPVVTLWAYDDGKEEEALSLCDTTSDYALTGAVFAQDRAAIERIGRALVGTAGNFYINDKPTGAVVGQQPFGGSRASGTNDKAGSSLNLLRWVSPRAIKETFVPARDYRYPFMDEP